MSKVRRQKDSYRRRKANKKEAKWQAFSKEERSFIEHDSRVIIDDEGIIYCVECLYGRKLWAYDACDAIVATKNIYKHLLYHQKDKDDCKG